MQAYPFREGLHFFVSAIKSPPYNMRCSSQWETRNLSSQCPLARAEDYRYASLEMMEKKCCRILGRIFFSGPGLQGRG